MHTQGADNFTFFKRCHAYETALQLKAEGKIRHFGISFHDRAEVLEQILTEYPQIEVVQIQFNYLDYEDPAVESRKCYQWQAGHCHGAGQGRSSGKSAGTGSVCS